MLKLRAQTEFGLMPRNTARPTTKGRDGNIFVVIRYVLSIF
jgi:hypothetical protein